MIVCKRLSNLIFSNKIQQFTLICVKQGSTSTSRRRRRDMKNLNTLWALTRNFSTKILWLPFLQYKPCVLVHWAMLVMYCSTALAIVSIVFQVSRGVFSNCLNSLIAHEQYSQVWGGVFVSLDILGCVHAFNNTVCQDVADTTPSIILYPSTTLPFPLSCLTLCEIRLSGQPLHAW